MSLKRLKTLRFLMIIAGMAVLLASCHWDDLPDIHAGCDETLQISVTTERFISGDVETRATDIGYTTTFAMGDKIGITVVKDGTTILEDNIPYEYDGLVWNPVISVNAVHFYPGTNIDYLVYYPYAASMNGKTAAAEIVAAFTPQADQSTLTAYTASDLMTGTGMLSSTTLIVTLTHALSLIELNFPSGVSSVTLDINGGTSLKPCFFEETFRYIAKPQDNVAELAGSYTVGSETMSWKLANVMLSAGKYIKINVFVLSVIEGYSGGVQVFYTDGSVEMATITDNGILKLKDGAGKTIMKIVLLDKGNKEYLIGRKTDQPLCLKFDTNGDLLFRPVIDGYTPIGSYAEFQKIRDNNTTRSGSYRQEADLDLMNMGWTSVGNNTNRFTGTYDGNNKTVSRLRINNTSLNYAGLFGAVSGTVANLNIIEADLKGGSRVGSLVGFVATGANVANCNTNGEVSGVEYVGGLVGYNEGTITNCNNSNKVHGGNSIGGIVGYSTGSSAVKVCENNGEINGTSRVGGIVGNLTNSTIETCKNNGTIHSVEYVGGIVGYLASSSTIEACENNGMINGTGTGSAIRVGGITGFVTTGSIVNACKSSGMVSGTGNMIGGIAGEVLNGGMVRNCYSAGEVVGVNDVGGVVGCVTTGSTIGFAEYCYSVSVVRGVNSVGGVAGLVNSGAIVSNCVALNPIVYASIVNIGRVAYSSGGNITNSLAWDEISNGGGILFLGGIRIAHNNWDGKSITSNQAMMQTTYINYIATDLPVPLNWDFINIWTIDEGHGYPTLRWE